MHATPHPPQRLRRLAAMGIDVYVRRDLLPDARAVDDAPVETAASATTAAPPEPAAGAAGRSPEASLAGARALLEDRAPPGPVAPQEPAPSATGPAPAGAEPALAAAAAYGDADGDADAAADAEVEAATEAAAGAEVPRFRLTALRAGAGLLLVDEALLPYERREVLARLGDLLRAGLLLREAGGARAAPAKRMETQAFFWPQVEAEHVDQSLARAVEALGAWVRRCTGDGEGCLVVVAPAPDSAAAAPLGALEALPVRRARIDAAFVTAPDADAHRAAWRSLAALAAGQEVS